MHKQHALKSLPPKEWVSDRVVVFDWFDGARRGVVRMLKPKCEFLFELLAERLNPDGLDDRLFRVVELPEGSVAKILDAIHSLGDPVNVVWVPVWRFGSEEERVRADRELDCILSQRKETKLVIRSRDMATFLGCWQLERRSDQTSDWFSKLCIA